MKKIGILTFFNTNNYGAMLQTFALYKKIVQLNGDCEIINYHCTNIEKRELITFPKFEGNIVLYFKNVIRFVKRSKKRNKFKSFLLNNLKLSSQEYNRNNIATSKSNYDKFLVGSDMVFELGKTGGDTTYYLDFVDSKSKYSYASSLGGREIASEYVEHCKNCLNKFKYVSVRENQAKEYLANIISRDIRVDIDPTLLHDKSFWKNYEEKPKKLKYKKYILLYFLDNKGIELKVAKRIAEERNWGIIIIANSKINIDECEVIRDSSIGEFLYYINHAELVITGSFHGMALSVNFNTNFMYYNEGKPLIRLDNLADIIDAKDRKIEENSIPKIKCDFDKINGLMESQRKKSTEYLKSIIDD